MAERAGVSEAVVSYVVRGGRPVAPETRSRVEQVIDELGYQPRAVARVPKRVETKTIGLVLPNSTNGFYAHLAHQVEATARRFGYSVLMGSSRGRTTSEAWHIRAFLERQVAGLIVVPGSETAAWPADLKNLNVRVVTIDREVAGAPGPAVLIDNVAAGRTAAQHLIAHGCVAIGCVAGPKNVSTIRERVKGIRQAAKPVGSRHKVTVLEPTYRPGTSYREGYDQAASFLADAPTRTALSEGLVGVVSTSDDQALGFIRGLHEKGVSVPRQVLVVSTDGLPQSQFSIPSLSSYEQPTELMAMAAVQALLTPTVAADATSERSVLWGRLVARESCCGEQRIPEVV